MGIVIDLFVNGSEIFQNEWEKVYYESCLLLQHFPCQLTALVIDEYNGFKRLLRTPEIFFRQSTLEEYWEINGDIISGRSGELFSLRKYFKRYELSDVKEKSDTDILWVKKDDVTYIESAVGVNIFGSKTQGYPYHLAVLAVAMLVESRFPGRAYMHGDIDEIQIETIIRWTNRILDVPVNLPVCCKAEELYSRLDALYTDKSLVIERFETLFIGSNEEKNTFLYHALKDKYLNHLKNNLFEYEIPSQLGAISIISDLINITNDVIPIIQITNELSINKKGFSLDALLKVFCQHFITIEMKDREPLLLYAKSNETLTTVEDTFSQVFMKLGGAPSAIDFYVSADELLDIFSSFEPENRSIFNEIINGSEKYCRQTLAKTLDLLKKMEEKQTQETRLDMPHPDEPEFLKKLESANKGALQTQNLSPEDLYILEQVYLQKEQFHEPEQIIKMINGSIQLLIEKNPDYFSDKNIDELKQLLVLYSYHIGFSLKKSAWNKIEKEDSLEIIKKLTAYTMADSHERMFHKFRVFLMENDYLWHLLTE